MCEQDASKVRETRAQSPVENLFSELECERDVRVTSSVKRHQRVTLSGSIDLQRSLSPVVWSRLVSFVIIVEVFMISCCLITLWWFLLRCVTRAHTPCARTHARTHTYAYTHTHTPCARTRSRSTSDSVILCDCHCGHNECDTWRCMVAVMTATKMSA